MSTQKIVIVGLGLIGGSLALSIKKNTAHFVSGIDLDPAVLACAIDSDAIDAGSATPEALIDADIVILCLYPSALIAFVQNNLHLFKKGCIVMDTCGVKQIICDALNPLAVKNGFTFIGGHPMAGKETQGFASATSQLFIGANMILTPLADCDVQPLTTIKQLLMKLGFAKIVQTTPQNHDLMIAFTSQIPHILASSYVKSPQSLLHQGYSAGSFRDVSRVASLNPLMWSELFLANGENLSNQIDLLINNLSDFRDALVKKDGLQLQALLDEGNIIKNKIV